MTERNIRLKQLANQVDKAERNFRLKKLAYQLKKTK